MKKNDRGVGCMLHVLGRREIGPGFWWGNLKEIDHFEGLGIDGRIILISTLRNKMGWNGLD
jgi:hypothetical protein